MFVALLPGDPSLFDVGLALFLLFGVPAVLFVVIATATAYIRQDAEQYLEELEAEGELEFEEGDGKPDLETGRDDSDLEAGTGSAPASDDRSDETAESR